jgi:WD40 repeat protein
MWALGGEERRVLRGHSGIIQQLAFGPRRVLLHGAAVALLRFSPDGRLLVTGTSDGVVRAWEVKSGALRAVLSGRSSYLIDLALSPDARWLAAVGEDGAVRLWDGVLDGPRAPASAADLDTLSSVVLHGDDAVSPAGYRDNADIYGTVADLRARALTAGD